eukprot:CAMPEP_0170455130 /NCGR_PEP_ID=MMETSP0123-20130129/3174_1 /TAXON_ID=182087 /ORGANISM="Favella ehrenbergii, Strain Fehren 1" /LENGTH=94 /DNA_ID=CAMNT_0010718119 /DNA_START=244 /DNA_END=528 /DNA_ORIENTATION=-
MTIVDTIRDQTRRIAHEHYLGTGYEPELLYLKLDHLMPLFLQPLNLSPIFLFGEKFAKDEKDERKRAKTRQKKLNEAQKKHKETGEAIDPNLLK